MANLLFGPYIGGGEFVDLKSLNPNPAIFKSKSTVLKKVKSKSTISKKFKYNPNLADLAKVAKSGFKSKSGFGFAHHCLQTH